MQYCGGGGDRGAGGVREAGEEGAGSGIPKVAEAGEKGKNYATLRNISQSKKMQRDGSQKIQGGNRDYRVREAGGLNPPVPPPPHNTVEWYSVACAKDTTELNELRENGRRGMEKNGFKLYNQSRKHSRYITRTEVVE